MLRLKNSGMAARASALSIKANNDFDCVCGTQAGRGPGFN
ncbi:hypothetical protein CTAM01_16514 [Colletotrichum tamarilloi]|uniref:Uncharacterized protein n=1 Tax=Colletotrichum tamarilloi TaxID=1209934 RepID=A0ABQ9QIB6_9PEZI|nr:uncharacterized protein CTAM01_16514 [Colletotrichum tamarilloi]KAK1471414.1 hypothetical protein CTAM01_16514 [Colletotrichum tamarilloi]